MAFVCFVFISCEKSSIEVPVYNFSQIVMHGRDSFQTFMSYNEEGALTEFNFYTYSSFMYKTNVKYTPNGLLCSINGIDYSVKWDAIKGASRASSVTATIDGATYYKVEYSYDSEGRLALAAVGYAGSYNGEITYVSYKYNESSILINDSGTIYEIMLSAEDNTGYVCNVLDFANSYHTSNFIINPDLYYLNIYGTPVMKLPSGYSVSRNNNNKISGVGKYFYGYGSF